MLGLNLANSFSHQSLQGASGSCGNNQQGHLYHIDRLVRAWVVCLFRGGENQAQRVIHTAALVREGTSLGRI